MTLIPTMQLRFVLREVVVPIEPIDAPVIMGKRNVLQQAFKQPDRDKLIWQDVPLIIEE